MPGRRYIALRRGTEFGGVGHGVSCPMVQYIYYLSYFVNITSTYHIVGLRKTSAICTSVLPMYLLTVPDSFSFVREGAVNKSELN